jgi:hypothetical protein
LNGLSFFHPEFFWALAALSVPLIIHLLNRRPPRRMEFSSLRFFLAGAVRKSRVRALKRFLLLLVRLCIVLLIVVLFLAPFDRRDPFTTLWNPDASVYAYVDPTISMDYRNHGATLWQEAFAALDSLDKMLSPSAKRWFYDDAGRAFVPLHAFPAPPPQVFSRHGPSGSDGMMAAFAEACMRGNSVPILIALSDFQDPESRVFDTAFARHLRAPVACVSVAPKDAWDYRVADVRMSNENYSTAVVRVASIGRSMKDAPLSVTVGGMRVGHASVTLDKGNQADVAVPVTADISRPAGEVHLEADDLFPLDNTGFFVRGTSRTVRVLVVGDAYESFPIAAAFESLGPLQWNVSTRKDNEVAYGDIDSVSLIVLCGVRHLSSALDMLVHGRSFGPKAILFSPVADSADAYSNNSVLSAVSRRPLSLVPDTMPRSLVLPDTLSALFAGFPRLIDLDARVFRYYDGLPGSAAVRLDNGWPLLTLLTDTLGNSWVLSATPLGLTPRGLRAANNLSETGLYVALLDRISRHALSAIHREPQAWTAGIPVRNPYLGSKGGALVFDASDRLVATWSRQPFVAFDDPGCYKIQPHGEAASWVAVGIDSSETHFSYRFPSVKRENETMARCMTADRFLSFVNESRHGSFQPRLWLALGCLLIAEVLLWERTRQGPQSRRRVRP